MSLWVPVLTAARFCEAIASGACATATRMHGTLTVDDPDHPELDGATVLAPNRAEGSLDPVAGTAGSPASSRMPS
ncbi:hypothetical protein [Streptomyces europaeiscabiei]|uniref:hypothetical protein n=1 Tax=Streptomyces europaeiscabiei TaxID=146819 RepID=UPI0029A84120|nr:hypothetical protein [Streptomyces europaeiscabiei]MDX2762963.1 hypothetical protein [Streptomyces europaeiscabiei]